MSEPVLAKVNSTGPHEVAVYLVVPTAIGAGVCTVDPGSGALLYEVPYYGSPVVGAPTPMLFFDGQLAVLGLASVMAANPCFSPQAGWSVTASGARWDGVFCEAYFNITRTGAQIPAASRGNITNSLAAVLLPGVPVPAIHAGMSIVGGSMLIGGNLNQSGELNVCFAPPGQPINTGDSFNGSLAYAY